MSPLCSTVSSAEDDPSLPSMCSMPALPSVAAFGTPNPPQDLNGSDKVMPLLAHWTDPKTGELLEIKSLKGGLAWPVQGAVSSPFGLREMGRRVRVHEGIDIPVPQGTPVQASRTGLVEEAATLNGYGKTVIIEHGNGLKTLYAHCSELLVQPGQKVETGQVIAYAGSTGRATSSHVHFGVMIADKFCDPSPHLRPQTWLAKKSQ